MVKVELENHSIVRRHLDQTRRRKESRKNMVDYPTVVSSQPIQQPPSTGDELVTLMGLLVIGTQSRNRKPPHRYY